MSFQSQPNSPVMLRSLVRNGFVRVNRSLEEELGLTSDQIAAEPLMDWIHPDDSAVFKDALDSGVGSARARHRAKQRDWVPFDWQVKTENGEVFALGRLALEVEVPLSPTPASPGRTNTQAETLESMALVVEAMNPEMRCSILLVDSTEKRVTVGAGPSFPDEYNDAVEGLRIGPTVGSCGTAAFWNVPVFVENIAEDPLWRDLRHAAEIAGVCACWSHPITAADGTVLGAMALYADEPRSPDQKEMDCLEAAARMVGLALERDRLQDQLRQAAKLEAIGRLAGGVAHDFNNILTAILGNVELMREGLPTAPDSQTLEKVTLAIDRASDITSQLLAFGRKQDRKAERLALSEVVLDIMRVLDPLIGDEITVSLNFDPSTGAVMIDRTQFSQIMMNLVINARDAMPEGGTIHIATRQATSAEVRRANLKRTPESAVVVTVADSGKGMDKFTIAHVFEPFFSTKETGLSSGLGLATAYGLILQNGGEVLVESEVDQGSTFTLFFPRAETFPTVHASAGEQPRLASVLIAEDDDEIRDLATHVLATQGFKVTGARDGVEAMALVDGGLGVDLLLTDVMMPRMGGIELTRRLRNVHPDAKVLLISGRPLEESGFDALSQREDRYLAKPFTPAKLRSEVHRAFSSGEAASEVTPK